MSHTEILFFGTAEIPRRNLNRLLDNFFEGDAFDEDETLVGIFFADDDWSATTDAAFDYVLESPNFDDEPVVLVPSDEDAVADQKLVDDLAKEGAELARYDDIYDGVLTRSEFTHAICLFDEEDEDLAEDVMRLVEDGRKVYDAVGGMLEFDIAVEDPDAEDSVDSSASVDSPESDDSAEEEDLHPKVKMALDMLHEALSKADDVGDIDSKKLGSLIGRKAMERTIDYLGIEQYKGMHTKTMVDESLDTLWADLDDEGVAAAPESVDSPESEDSPEEEPAQERGSKEDPAKDKDRDRPVQGQTETTIAARPATAHVNFADIVALLGLFTTYSEDGDNHVDVDGAVEAAAAFGLTFDDARDQ